MNIIIFIYIFDNFVVEHVQRTRTCTPRRTVWFTRRRCNVIGRDGGGKTRTRRHPRPRPPSRARRSYKAAALLRRLCRTPRTLASIGRSRCERRPFSVTYTTEPPNRYIRRRGPPVSSFRYTLLPCSYRFSSTYSASLL